MEGVHNKQFHAIGVNHRSTPIQLREKLNFRETSTKKFLKRLNELLGIDEVLMLSTCNRTEIYYSNERTLSEEIVKLLFLEKGIDHEGDEDLFYKLSGNEAVEHLFRVSLGLDAKVLGDIQIINQVKSSYQWSSDQGLVGPFLHRLMHSIFFANKRVGKETTFRNGAGSVASVAVALVRSHANVVKEPKILLIGTGEIGQNVLKNLGDENGDVSIINRTKSSAEEIAEYSNCRVGEFENLSKEVNSADVVIAAVRVDKPIISEKNLNASMTHRLVIDLSVPRSVDESVQEVPGTLLFNVDQIEEKASEILAQRQKEVPMVDQILNEQLNEFFSWSEEMAVSPTIQLLKKKLEQIRRDEIAQHLKGLSEKEQQLIDSVTRNMIQKVIKLPVLELKAACRRGEAESLIEALEEVFDLEKSTQKST